MEKPAKFQYSFGLLLRDEKRSCICLILIKRFGICMERPDCERKGSYLEKRDAAYLPSPSKEQSKFQVNALALQRDKTYVSSIYIYIYIYTQYISNTTSTTTGLLRKSLGREVTEADLQPLVRLSNLCFAHVDISQVQEEDDIKVI